MYVRLGYLQFVFISFCSNEVTVFQLIVILLLFEQKLFNDIIKQSISVYVDILMQLKHYGSPWYSYYVYIKCCYSAEFHFGTYCVECTHYYHFHCVLYNGCFIKCGDFILLRVAKTKVFMVITDDAFCKPATCMVL